MNTHTSGVDMNDGNNLSIYTELSIFKRESDVVRREILFKDLDQKEQRNLHCLALDLGLEYEYSLTTSTARISRSGILPALDIRHGGSHVEASFTPDIVDSFQVAGYGNLPLSPVTSESVEGQRATTTAASEIDMDWLNFPQNPTLPPLSSFSAFADELLFNPDTVQEPILFGHENMRHTSKYPPNHQNTTTNSSTRSTSRGRVMPDTPSSPHPASTSSRPTSPGRVGPLSPYARAAMKAVKDLGACWRCKILRKQCDTEVPCTTCPKTGIATVEPGNWTGVGCRRRELRNEMAKVLLCPNSNPSYGRLPLSDGKVEALTTANKCWQENLKSRQEAMESKHALVTSQKTDIDCFLQELELIKPIVEGLRLARIRQSEQELPALSKLDQCILDIIWELSDCSASEGVVGQKNVSDLVVFLRAAALYQAKYGKDQLIANSLDCLRSSLEAIKVKAVGKLNSSAHYCGKTQCQVNCTSKLDTHLNEYLDELSRVFFKKDNMRNKLWWLSAFYSFTIQSFVRKALTALVDDATTQPLWAREYLYLPLRLFIAISSKHDPLSKSSDIDPSWVDEETTIEVYETARLLIRPKDNENQDSADYLKKLFEDNGSPLYQSADFELFSSPNPVMAVDRMSMDNITNPQIGSFQCTYPGCTAPAFQTQYLLNSHTNIHSSNRPHYCPVKGCPRSEGGKGFKRKNEMIRHGLVHDNPGYVCPFCLDREHKYPRPDNLQRHVRVHHADKDKDDPQLREVLSQPREGPNRGRRRRPVTTS